MSNSEQILDSPSKEKITEVSIKGIKVFIAITILDILLFFGNTLRFFSDLNLPNDLSRVFYVFSALIFSIMFVSVAFILNAFKENPFTATIIYIYCVASFVQSLAFYFINTNYSLLSYISLPSTILVIILIVRFFLVKHTFIKSHFKLLATALIISRAQQYLIPFFVGAMDTPSQTIFYGNLIYLTVPIIILMIQLKVSKVKLEYSE
jgi:hypothetical protein